MAKRSFYVHLDLNNNQLLNTVLENVNPLPGTGAEGRIVYNSLTKKIMFHDDVEWKNVGTVQNITGTLPIVVTPAAGVYDISINPATQSSSGSLSAADKIKLDNLIQIDDDTDVPHAAGGSEHIIGTTVNVFNAISSLDAWGYAHTGSGDEESNRPHGELKFSEMDTATDLGGAGSTNAKAASQLAIKTYVDAQVGSSGRPAEPYPTGGLNVPYPPTYDGGAILKGDQFIISDDGGSIGPVTHKDVNSNDTIIANQDGATNDHSQWTVIISTPVQDATYTIKGIQRNATQVEASAGSLENATITPKTLHGVLGDIHVVIEKTKTAATESITVDHLWNNIDVLVSAHIVSSGEELYGQVVKSLASATVTLNSGSAVLIGGDWTVVVAGEDKS